MSAQAINIPKRVATPKGEHVLSTSFGGSIYGTSLGGTRYKYDRAALLAFKNSPLSRSPANVPKIPGITKVQAPAAPRLAAPDAGNAVSAVNAGKEVEPTKVAATAATPPAAATATASAGSGAGKEAAKPNGVKSTKPNPKSKSTAAEDDALFDMDS